MNDLINYVIAKKLASKIKLTKGQYDVKGKVLLEELDYTEHTLAKVNKVLGKLPEKTREGKTTINGIVRVISPETGLVIPKARG